MYTTLNEAGVDNIDGFGTATALSDPPREQIGKTGEITVRFRLNAAQRQRRAQSLIEPNRVRSAMRRHVTGLATTPVGYDAIARSCQAVRVFCRRAVSNGDIVVALPATVYPFSA